MYRDYQGEAAAQVAAHIIAGKRRPLVVQPTGSGKTITACAIAMDTSLRAFFGATDRPLKILFVAHRRKLLRQAHAVFDACSADTEVRTVSLGSTDVVEWLMMIEWCDFIMFDEAHHEACITVQHLLDQLMNRVMVGFTATPDRPDRHLIKFDCFIEPMTREEAVERGVLAETELTTILEYSGKDKTDVISSLFQHFRAQLGRCIVFVRTKAECRTISVRLRELNIRAVAITSQSEYELDVILNDFSAGRLDVLVSCKKISEGTDVKGCDTIILGKRSTSPVQVNQEIGRGARPDTPLHVWQLWNPFEHGICVTRVVTKLKMHRVVSYINNQWTYVEVENELRS